MAGFYQPFFQKFGFDYEKGFVDPFSEDWVLQQSRSIERINRLAKQALDITEQIMSVYGVEYDSDLQPFVNSHLTSLQKKALKIYLRQNMDYRNRKMLQGEFGARKPYRGFNAQGDTDYGDPTQVEHAPVITQTMSDEDAARYKNTYFDEKTGNYYQGERGSLSSARGYENIVAQTLHRTGKGSESRKVAQAVANSSWEQGIANARSFTNLLLSGVMDIKGRPTYGRR